MKCQGLVKNGVAGLGTEGHGEKTSSGKETARLASARGQGAAGFNRIRAQPLTALVSWLPQGTLVVSIYLKTKS